MEDMTVKQIWLCERVLAKMRKADELRWLEDHKFKDKREISKYIAELLEREKEFDEKLGVHHG